MPDLKNVANIWKNIREVDLRPLREQATRELGVAIVGRQSAGKRALAAQMLSDPSRPEVAAGGRPLVLDIDESRSPSELTSLVGNPDLIVVVLEADRFEDPPVRRLAKYWSDMDQNVLVIVNTGESASDEKEAEIRPSARLAWQGWESSRMLFGEVVSQEVCLDVLVPAVSRLLLGRQLALGRNYPLFRIPLARRMIDDTCTANAAYSLGTGIAEIAPVLDIPLNVADIIVLTKAQAFLVYKLGLLLGLSTNWQDYVTEFGGVLGGGFFWRQVARQLIGLIPAWGIVPKVAVAYAGTYVVGNVVLQWYLTGRHISRGQVGQLYKQAYRRGKDLARDLIARTPRLGRKGARQGELPPPQDMKICPACGKLSAADARYCQYCGQELRSVEGQV